MSTLIPEGHLSPADLDRLREKLAAEATHLVTRSDGPLSDDEARRVDELEDALRTINVRVQQLDLIARSAGNSTNLSGDGTVHAGPQIMRRVQPWGETSSRLAPAELVDRAKAAVDVIDRSDIAERVLPQLDRDDAPATADLIVAGSNPQYLSAFRGWLRDPQGFSFSMSEAERSAWRAAEAVRTSLQLGNTGAVMVPTTLDPTVRITSNGSINPFRDIADVRTTTSDQWDGVTSTGVTAEWVAEATEVADATPTLTSPSIPVHKADAHIQASMEQAADSNIGDQIAMLIADAKDTLEATAFATGTGSVQPTGLLTTLSSTTASRVAGSSGSAGAADLVIADVYALANALPPRYRNNTAWLAEVTTLNRVRALGTTYGSAFWAELGVDVPANLLGRPVHQSSAMDSTIVSGSNDDVLVLGDFSKGYVVVDRMGMTIMHNPLVVGANRRPTGEVSWTCFWRTGGLAVDPNAFRLLRL